MSMSTFPDTNLTCITNNRDPDDIPDDIWISVFECISSLAQLGRLMLTCRRFYTLASPLRRLELNWTTSNSTLQNLNGWMGAYRKSIALPQKLTLRLSMQIQLVPWAAHSAYTINRSLRQYVVMHACIPSFTSLREVVLRETTVSPYTYTVLATLPSLRSLSLLRCTFSGLIQPPAPAIAAMFLSLSSLPENPDHHPEQYQEQEQELVQPTTFTSLPITYLALTPKRSIGYYSAPSSVTAFHPPLNILHTICATTISTLCVEWSDYLAALFVLHKWLFPALRDLDVTTPLLSRSLLQSLVAFVHTCASDPKIEMSIYEEHLLELQICAMEMPLVGEWLQEGRLQVRVQEQEYYGCFDDDDDALQFPASFYRQIYSSPYVHNHDEQPTLHRFAPTDSLSVRRLLPALERLPKTLQILEVKLLKWSIGGGTELLFAIRELFPDIQRLVFRYGEGSLPANLFVTLSGDIMPALPNLHTLKLISDPTCRMVKSFEKLTTTDGTDLDTQIQGTRPFIDVDPVLQHTDLEGYLRGWNRHCKSLRCVQVDVGPCWERRFEGDRWVDVTAARDEAHECVEK